MSWLLQIFPFLYAIIISSIGVSSDDVLELWEATSLGSVTYFEGINEYYKTRRQQRLEIPPMEPLNQERKIGIKKKICKRIFTSHFFREQKIKWVNTDLEKICKEVKKDNKQAFYDIFNEYEYEGRCLPISGQAYDYENMYRVRPVRVNENEEAVDEYLFRCLARNRETKTIKEYFVSRAYNVNISEDHHPIAGRFVFSCEESDSEVLTLIAMAEQAAVELKVLRKMKVFSLMLCTVRSYLKSTDAAELDPVCILSPAEKLRLCSAMFSAAPFRKSVKFSPVLENVEVDCQRKKVAYLWGLFAWLEEWVIGCKARSRWNNHVVTYYVSRGHGGNSIFIYTPSGQQNIALFTFCWEVSVVRQLTAY